MMKRTLSQGARAAAALALAAWAGSLSAHAEETALLDVRFESGHQAEIVRFVMSTQPPTPTLRILGESKLALEFARARNLLQQIPPPASLRLLRDLHVEERVEGKDSFLRVTLSLSPGAHYRLEPAPEGFRLVLTSGDGNSRPPAPVGVAEAVGPAPVPHADPLLPATFLPPHDGGGERPPVLPGDPAPPQGSPAPPGDYVIGKQDLLQISVFQLDALDQTVRVQDDGTITLPLVGEVRAEGMPRKELEREIAGRLSPRYLLDPQVTVFVEEFQSKKVAVLGAVKRPGTYDLIGRRTLLEMLSLAEGVLEDRAAPTLQVLRRDQDGTARTLPVDLSALEAGDPAANIPIRGGDIIQVPVDDLIHIYVNGAVRKPDVFEVKRSEPVTVLKAVTMAGGVNERGSERRIQVVRQMPDGAARVIRVDLKRIKKGKNPDIVLEDNDVVVVPEAYF